jgi:hypothetical protein
MICFFVYGEIGVVQINASCARANSLSSCVKAFSAMRFSIDGGSGPLPVLMSARYLKPLVLN